ncbi:Di-copper centre-containing protein [Coprinellus micaceus]|uniref:Di-copper centre-containing protein n=1 Tax=Coprinellus micaceus TaxID=71717 RepID=A0A4Y7SXX2_COPMI|nr:Di-copper centre-containing protein [Coprinellus micaceus]
MFIPRFVLCLAVSAAITGATALPTTEPSSAPKVAGSKCSTIDYRRGWRDLTVLQRLSYIDAVHCLHKLPPHDKTRAATTRFGEFQATHILLTDRVHSVATSFLDTGTSLLCTAGLSRRSVYWDWTRDDPSLPVLKSPIFDPVTGFGGDGVPGTYTLPSDPKNESAVLTPFPGAEAFFYKGCVQDGPFKDWVVHLGPGRMVTDHCLVRGVQEMFRYAYTTAHVEETLQSKTYEEFRIVIDDLMFGIHGSGLALVGGEMTNTYSAGADPLFYLHHGGLDRVWWKWQQADPANRLYDISGPTTQGGSDTVTLDFMLDFPALGPNITVRDSLDSSLEPNCFIYE